MALPLVNGYSFQAGPQHSDCPNALSLAGSGRSVSSRQSRLFPRCENTFLLLVVCSAALLLWALPASASSTKDADADTHEPTLKPAPTLASPEIAPPKEAKPDKYDAEHIGERGIGGGLNMYSLERERSLGASMAASIDRHIKFYPDPEVYDYLNGLAQKIARHSDSQMPLTIRVIDSPDMNVFSLPGGYLYINKGLIVELDSEAELAGLIAHEIAHIAARHGTRLATRKYAWNMVSVPISYAAGPAGMATQLVPLTFKKFSRDAELEADLLALQYQNDAGYDPQAYLDALERWNSKEKQRNAHREKVQPLFSWAGKIPFHHQIAGSFSNYPGTEERITKIQSEMATHVPPRDDYIIDTNDFQEIKAKLQWEDRPILRRHAPGEGNINAPVLRRHPTDEVPEQQLELAQQRQ